MYEFFLIESPEIIDEETVLNNDQVKALSTNFILKNKSVLAKHILSHQHLYATFYELEIDSPLKSKQFIKIHRSKLIDYALPQLIIRYLQHH